MKLQDKDLTDVLNSWIYDLEQLHKEDDAKTLSHALDTGSDWGGLLDERQEKECRFAWVYSNEFSHGTAGHNRLELIAKLTSMLDVYEDALHKLIEYADRGKIS